VAATLRLILEDDGGHRQVVPFDAEEISVGRGAEGNAVRLPDRDVSRRHARFVRMNGAVFVEDLRSANGTRVNGERIEGRRRVREGDLIQIGAYDLAVEGATATTEVPVQPAKSAAPTLPDLPVVPPPAPAAAPPPIPAAAPPRIPAASTAAPAPPAGAPPPPVRLELAPAPARAAAPPPGLGRHAGLFVAIGVASIFVGWAAGRYVRRSAASRPAAPQIAAPDRSRP
jgi:predicted component of type VI protein secretion system